LDFMPNFTEENVSANVMHTGIVFMQLGKTRC